MKISIPSKVVKSFVKNELLNWISYSQLNADNNSNIDKQVKSILISENEYN